MHLWRISNYASLSGEGGLSFEGRWHEIGIPIVYMAASPPGALIEVLVHLELDEAPAPEHYQLLQIEAPDALLIENLTPDHKPAEPCTLHHAATRALGDAWLRSGRSALAQVPSAILPSTWNFLLNPSHPDAAQVTIQGSIHARHDERMFRKMRG